MGELTRKKCESCQLAAARCPYGTWHRAARTVAGVYKERGNLSLKCLRRTIHAAPSQGLFIRMEPVFLAPILKDHCPFWMDNSRLNSSVSHLRPLLIDLDIFPALQT